MCMVDIEKMPKAQISCNTVATEGMVVRTDTEKIRETVKGVLELHLINHPLDCPICDKAGECKLQDFYLDYGLYSSRMSFEKVHKPKVQDIGTIMLDSERCILCTRCVRFTEEVSKTNELGIFNRGDRSELRTYDGGPLRNDYTGNLADICPVGALTAKDFRFQCRVWFLQKHESVCTSCARGCNTTVSVNPDTRRLYRVEPRRNPEVNRSWICDTGRWDFHSVYEGRIPTPLVNDNGWKESTWNEAFKSIGDMMAKEGMLIFLSTQLTNEELIDSVTTYSQLGVQNYCWLVNEEVTGETEPYDGVLKHRDVTPNARGFSELSRRIPFANLGITEARARLKKGSYSGVLVVGLEGERCEAWDLIAESISVPLFVHASNRRASFERACWLLPNVSSFEKTGTVINALGRVQKLTKALPLQGLSRDAHQLAWGIAQRGDRLPLPSNHPARVFEEMVRPQFCPNESLSKFPPLGVPLG